MKARSAWPRTHGELVKQALRIKKVGNEIVALLGGRSVHPVGVCVGGFYRPPDTEDARRLANAIKPAIGEMCEITLKLAREIEFPELARDYEMLSLSHESQYPMNLGRIRSNRGLNVAQEEFLDVVDEFQVPHSTAYHAKIRQRGAYLVGPLARLNLNHEKLHPAAAGLLREIAKTGFPLPWNNNFLSLLARGVETVHSLALAHDLLSSYQRPLGPRGVGGQVRRRRPRHRSSARTVLASLRNQRRRLDTVGSNCPSHQPKPIHHRSGPARHGRACCGRSG